MFVKVVTEERKDYKKKTENIGKLKWTTYLNLCRGMSKD